MMMMHNNNNNLEVCKTLRCSVQANQTWETPFVEDIVWVTNYVLNLCNQLLLLCIYILTTFVFYARILHHFKATVSLHHLSSFTDYHALSNQI